MIKKLKIKPPMRGEENRAPINELCHLSLYLGYIERAGSRAIHVSNVPRASQATRGICPQAHLSSGSLLGRNVVRNDVQLQVTFTNVTFTKSIGVDFEGIFASGDRPSGGPNGQLGRN